MRILSLFLVILSFHLQAQNVWTLEQCIDYAYQRNLSLKQAQNNVLIQDQNLLQSRASQLPTVNGVATHNYNFGRNIDPFTNQFTTSRVQSNNFSLTGSMILFNGSQVRHSIAQNRLERAAGEQQTEILKNDLALALLEAYLQILYAGELLKASEQRIALTKMQLARAERLHASGVINTLQLLDWKSQLAQEEAQKVVYQNQHNLSYLNLRLIMDIPEDSFTIAIPGSLTLPDSLALSSPNDVYLKALEWQPSIKYAQLRQQSAFQGLAISRGRRLPRLTLNGSISTLYSSSSKQLVSYQYNGVSYVGYVENTLDSVFAPRYQGIFESKPYFDQIKDNLNKFVGLTLSVPILNGLQAHTAVQRSQLQIQNADLDIRIARQNLQKNILKAHADALAAQSNYKASLTAAQTLDETYQAAEKRYENGVINGIELNQLKTRLYLSQSDLIRAKYDYVWKGKLLDYYKGMPIKM